MRAAASCDAPILRPVIRFAPRLPRAALTFGSFGLRSLGAFGSLGAFSLFAFGCFGARSAFGFFWPPISFFQNGTFGSGSGTLALTRLGGGPGEQHRYHLHFDADVYTAGWLSDRTWFGRGTRRRLRPGEPGSKTEPGSVVKRDGGFDQANQVRELLGSQGMPEV